MYWPCCRPLLLAEVWLVLLLLSPAVAGAGGSRDCSPKWVDTLAKIANGELGPQPQLTPVQMALIAADLNARRQQAGPVNFLVFGVGHDSIGWSLLNCGGGRTAFLEGHAGWLADITSKHPQLEAYPVTYKGDMRQAAAFFNAPWLLPLPPNISTTCWPVILVDAPQGYDPSQGQPGRMESSYAALHLARHCLQQQQQQQHGSSSSSVSIWLHDVNRPLEQEIISKLFINDPWIRDLGTYGGGVGTLQGFVMQAPVAGDAVALKAGNSNTQVGSSSSNSSNARQERQLRYLQYSLIGIAVEVAVVAAMVFKQHQALKIESRKLV